MAGRSSRHGARRPVGGAWDRGSRRGSRRRRFVRRGRPGHPAGPGAVRGRAGRGLVERPSGVSAGPRRPDGAVDLVRPRLARHGRGDPRGTRGSSRPRRGVTLRGRLAPPGARRGEHARVPGDRQVEQVPRGRRGPAGLGERHGRAARPRSRGPCRCARPDPRRGHRVTPARPADRRSGARRSDHGDRGAAGGPASGPTELADPRCVRADRCGHGRGRHRSAPGRPPPRHMDRCRGDMHRLGTSRRTAAARPAPPRVRHRDRCRVDRGAGRQRHRRRGRARGAPRGRDGRGHT